MTMKVFLQVVITLFFALSYSATEAGNITGGSISINNGTAYTNSATVALSLSCRSTSGTCSHMEFSNDNINWSAPDAYATTKTWNTTVGDGAKTIYVKFKDSRGNGGWSAAYSDSIVLDTTPPSVSVTSPAANTTFTAAQTVLIRAYTASDGGMTKVEFYDNGFLKGTSTSSPYNYAWSIAPSNNGGHKWVAKACDAAGNSATSTPIDITINIPFPDSIPPEVSITNPASGTTYATAQAVTISASASDNAGVTKVEFYDGATLMATDSSSPYFYAWSVTASNNGIHNWSARAYDAAGNIAISQAASLIVNIETPSSSMQLDDTWSGTANQNYANDMAFDGTYLYAAFNSVPASVAKIDASTMNTVSTWAGWADDTMAENIAFDGRYLYVSTQNTPGRVIKINPDTMTSVGRWTGQIGEDMASLILSDGNYIYVEFYTSPAKVVKIDPATMTTVDTWTGQGGENIGLGMSFDGTYLYAGLYVSPAKIIKINPATMTTEGTWTGYAGENLSRHLTFGSNFIYVTLDTSPAQVIKIDPGVMTAVNKWTGDAGQDIGFSMSYDGKYLYAGLETNPAQIVKLNTDTMTAMTSYIADPGDAKVSSLIADGPYLYAALYMMPAKVLRILSGP